MAKTEVMRKVTLLGALLFLPLPHAYASQLLVGNYFANSISRFDTNSAAYLGDFTGGGLVHPQGICLGTDSNFYVASEGTNSVLRYSSSGSFTDSFFSSSTLNGPTGMCFERSGNLLVGSFNANAIFRISGTGTSISTAVSPGSGGLSGPDIGTVVGPDGVMYVTSFNTNSVLKFNLATGASLGTFVASNSGGLTHPRGLVFRGGNAFVTSEDGNSVLRYAMDGSFLGTFISTGSGGLSGASGLRFDTDGTLYLTSWRNNRILHYNSNGGFLGTFATGGSLNGPTYLMIVPEPASILLISTGLLALRRKRAPAR